MSKLVPATHKLQFFLQILVDTAIIKFVLPIINMFLQTDEYVNTSQSHSYVILHNFLTG